MMNRKILRLAVPRIAAFILSLSAGLVFWAIWGSGNSTQVGICRTESSNPPISSETGTAASGSDFGSGYSGPNHIWDEPTDTIVATGNAPLNIKTKQKAQYTAEARENNIQGTVVLRVTFLANGQIDSVIPQTRLPYGLTDNAIKAARAITFEPRRINGRPVSLTKTVEYNFSIY